MQKNLKDNLIDSLSNTPSREKWLEISAHRRSGILAPLFSVYSDKSIGIGDFQDLKLLVDWCKRSGNSIIQLLPMNETGMLNCPYDSVSSFALEPAYLSFHSLGTIKRLLLHKRIGEMREKYPLNKNKYVDYGIKEEKLKLLWDVYNKENLELPQDFDSFRAENAYWLEDFALYKVIKYYEQGRPWYEWQIDYRNRNRAVIADFLKTHKKEIDFQMWLQWLAFKEFKEAKEYAENKDVLLKGDLPILVSRDSADVWAHQEFFKLEFAAGAPPDMYCAKGQRWGMPTYHWPNIIKDNYTYLKEKLKYAQNFYDILRIDHVVGLFRIWSIPYSEPAENQGLNGSFDPQDEGLWEAQGRSVLSILLNNTTMLLCAEDLGIIPSACPKALADFGIPGNEVQRWAKDWKIRHDFLDPKDLRFLAITMLSNHDTTNYPAWWENEAGTIDEDLFKRKCLQYGIDYSYVKNILFNAALSKHGRLKWAGDIKSTDIVASILGRQKEQIRDIIDLYENSYQEKEKLWLKLGLNGAMQEKCDKEIVRLALKFTFQSQSIFCINLITDFLYLAGNLEGDAYDWRVNTPGTISNRNWSLLMPVSLDNLMGHPVTGEIKSLVRSSDRI
jgi:4-alpha-glucanotransferase